MKILSRQCQCRVRPTAVDVVFISTLHCMEKTDFTHGIPWSCIPLLITFYVTPRKQNGSPQREKRIPALLLDWWSRSEPSKAQQFSELLFISSQKRIFNCTKPPKDSAGRAEPGVFRSNLSTSLNSHLRISPGALETPPRELLCSLKGCFEGDKDQ